MSGNDEREVYKLAPADEPVICEVCGGKLKVVGNGLYECESCHHQQLDDFGKIKKFLREKGPASLYDIYEGTGIEMEEIEHFLRDERLEIPEGSKFFLKCQKCGRPIRLGKYCPECSRTAGKGIRSAYRGNGAQQTGSTEDGGIKVHGRMYTYNGKKKK